MEMPSFPTDSLYKFQALTGIVLMVLAMWYFEKNLSEVELDMEKLSGEAAIIKAQSVFLNEDVEGLSNRIQSVSKTLTLDISESTKVASELEDKKRELEFKNIELNNKWRLVDVRFRQIKGLWWGVKLSLPIIVLWTTWGFLNWKRKIQLQQDRILQNEAERTSTNRRK